MWTPGRCGIQVTFESRNDLVSVNISHLRDFTVEVHDFGAARTFMQVIDVLSNNSYIEVLFKSRDFEVGCVRLHLSHRSMGCVEEVKHSRSVLEECFSGANFLNVVVVPDAAFIAEGRNPTFSRNARTSEYN
ncbi:hypothetical protein D3C80_1199850 [compost metagenome]